MNGSRTMTCGLGGREPGAAFPTGLRIGFWLCIVIAIGAVARRAIVLASPPNTNLPPQLTAFDAYFASHATLTLVHIVSALVFVLLLPLLYWGRTRDSAWLERIAFPLGVIVGVTAYAMSTHAIGG